jgi:hypothetical protein
MSEGTRTSFLETTTEARLHSSQIKTKGVLAPLERQSPTETNAATTR